MNESPTCWIFTLSFSSLSNQKLLQTPLKGICVFIFLISPCQNVLFSCKSGNFFMKVFYIFAKRWKGPNNIYFVSSPPKNQKIDISAVLHKGTMTNIFFLQNGVWKKKVIGVTTVPPLVN